MSLKQSPIAWKESLRSQERLRPHKNKPSAVIEVIDDATAKLELDRIECGAALESFTETRNRLIREGRSTDTINELIVKVAHAPVRRRRGVREER
jgi:hypothetical protein